MSSSKYAMEVEVTGNAEAKLDKIGESLSKVTQNSHAMSGGLSHANESLESISRSSHGSFFHDMSESIEQAGEKMEEFGKKVMETAEETIHGIIEMSAEFEDIQSSMRFSFGAAWEGMYDKALKESKHLSFTFKQVSDTVAQLGKSGINAFGGMDEAQQQFMTKTGKMTGAMDVLQDTVAGTGLSMGESGRVLMGMREAMAGNMREFKMGLAMPHELLEKIKHGLAGATTQQEKYNAIIKELGKFYGGATLEKMANYSYQIQQLTDKMELLQGVIGGPVLKTITAGLTTFVDALGRLIDDKDAMKSLSDGFMAIGKGISWVMKASAAMVDWGAAVLKAAPWLGRLAGWLGVMAAFGSLAAAALAGLVVSFAGFAAMFLAIGWEPLVGALAMVVGLLPLILPVVAVVSALLMLLKVGADTTKEQWGPVMGFFEKFKITITALSELWDTYNGSTATMSMETADKLRKSGMLDFVMSIMSAVHMASAAWAGFSDGLDEISEQDGPYFVAMIAEIEDAFYDVRDALMGLNGAMETGNEDTDDWNDTGRSFAQTLADMTLGLIQVIRWGIAIGRVVMNFLPLKFVLTEIVSLVKSIISLFEMLGSIKIGAGGATVGSLMGKAFGDAKGGGFGGMHQVHEDRVGHGQGRRRSDMAGQDFRDDKGNFTPWNDMGYKVDSDIFKTEDEQEMERKRRFSGRDAQGRGRGIDMKDIKRMSKGGTRKHKEDIDYGDYSKADAEFMGADWEKSATPELRRAVSASQTGTASNGQKELIASNQRMAEALGHILQTIQRGHDIHIDGDAVGHVVAKSKGKVAG